MNYAPSMRHEFSNQARRQLGFMINALRDATASTILKESRAANDDLAQHQVVDDERTFSRTMRDALSGSQETGFLLFDILQNEQVSKHAYTRRRQEFIELIKRNVRQSDSVIEVRNGQFSIVLKKGGLLSASIVAHRLKQQVENMNRTRVSMRVACGVGSTAEYTDVNEALAKAGQARLVAATADFAEVDYETVAIKLR